MMPLAKRSACMHADAAAGVVITSASCRNGSCLLVVKPTGGGDVPSLVDLQEFGDVQSYINHADLHARMLQLDPAASPAATPPAISVSILSFVGALRAAVRRPPSRPPICRLPRLAEGTTACAMCPKHACSADARSICLYASPPGACSPALWMLWRGGCGT